MGENMKEPNLATVAGAYLDFAILNKRINEEINKVIKEWKPEDGDIIKAIGMVGVRMLNRDIIETLMKDGKNE